MSDTGTRKLLYEPPLGEPSTAARLWEEWKKRSATIRFRILGLVAFSVLMPSFVGGWLAISYLDSVIREQVYNDLDIKTERIADDVSSWLTDRTLDVRAFTSTHILVEEVNRITSSLINNDPERSRKSLNGYLSYLLEDNTLFSGFLIMGPEGDKLASQPDDLEFRFAGDSLQFDSARPLVMDLTTGDADKIVIVQAMGGARSGAKPLFVSFTESGQLIDSLRGEADPETTIYLMEKRGRLIGTIGRVAEKSETPREALDFLHGNVAPLLYRGISGEKVIGTGAPIGHLDWTLVLEVPSRAAFKPLRTFRRILFVVAILLAGVLFFPAMMLARTISQPLEELSRVSREIRSGGAGTVVKARTGGELGDLIGTFNSMSLSMKDSMEEISVINERLRMMSVTDPLTGLFNRRYSEDHLKREMKLLKRTGENLSLLILDLDNFKDYNDTYGHIAGDEALKQLSEIMMANVRDTDIVARYGGEEFLVIMTHTAKEGAKNAAQKLRRAVEENVFQLKGQDTRITVSIGVATAPENADLYEELLDSADGALYSAKSAGRNRVRTARKRRRKGSTPAGHQGSEPGSSSPDA
jgi:diguanylate cyclase (GGDEF)-like protein